MCRAWGPMETVLRKVLYSDLIAKIAISFCYLLPDVGELQVHIPAIPVTHTEYSLQHVGLSHLCIMINLLFCFSFLSLQSYIATTLRPEGKNELFSNNA